MSGKRERWSAFVLVAVALSFSVGCHRRPTPAQLNAEADGLYLRASSEYLQGQFDAALATYAQVRKLRPLDPRLPAAEGEVHLSQGKLRDALEDFQRAAKLDPNRATTWSRIGFIQAQLKMTEARESLERAVALNAGDFNALEQLGTLDVKAGDPDAGILHDVAAARAATPRDAPALWLRAERLLVSQGKGKEATALLEDAADHGAADAELLTELGNRLVAQGALEAAARRYEEAARRSPKDPTLWELVGEIDLRRKKFPEAEAAFRASLKVADRATVHVALARLRLGVRDAPGADAELNQALATFSGHEARESRELADLLTQMGRGGDALRLLKVLADEPDQAKDLDLQQTTARLAQQNGDETTLAACCLRVRALKPGSRCP